MIEKLYRKDLIFKSTARTQEAVLTEVSTILYEKGIVQESFVHALVKREAKHPTGIDLSPVAPGLPNIAVPHTDAGHCKERAIAFVKMTEPVLFYNMMQPTEKLEVSYLFVLINDQKQVQANMLAELMDFITAKGTMQQLDSLDSKEALYEFLSKQRSDEHD